MREYMRPKAARPGRRYTLSEAERAAFPQLATAQNTPNRLRPNPVFDLERQLPTETAHYLRCASATSQSALSSRFTDFFETRQPIERHGRSARVLTLTLIDTARCPTTQAPPGHDT